MKYRFFRVTAVVAVANYDDDACDEHAHLGIRTALDAVEMVNDSDDLLLEITEQELRLTDVYHLSHVAAEQKRKRKRS